MLGHNIYHSQSDNHIDKYMIGGTQTGIEARDNGANLDDGLFAQPIEDEDIFGVNPSQEDQPKNDAESERDGLKQENLLDTDNEFHANAIDTNHQTTVADRGSPSIPTNPPDQRSPSPLPPISPKRLRMMQLRENLRQQAKQMAIIPKKLGSGVKDDRVIEIDIEENRLVSDAKSKLMLSKLINKTNSPQMKNKSNWESYKESLRKKMCAKKRKVWDTFQAPIETFDDEEEIFEDSDTKENEDVESNDGASNEDEDEDVAVDSNDGKPVADGAKEDDQSEDDEHVFKSVRNIHSTSDDDDDSPVDEEDNFEDLEREDLMVLDEAKEDKNGQEKDDYDSDEDNLSDLVSEFDD